MSFPRSMHTLSRGMCDGFQQLIRKTHLTHLRACSLLLRSAERGAAVPLLPQAFSLCQNLRHSIFCKNFFRELISFVSRISINNRLNISPLACHSESQAKWHLYAALRSVPWQREKVSQKKARRDSCLQDSYLFYCPIWKVCNKFRRKLQDKKKVNGFRVNKDKFTSVEFISVSVMFHYILTLDSLAFKFSIYKMGIIIIFLLVDAVYVKIHAFLM